MTVKPYLAESLVIFRDSINAAFPHRDKSSDGWIGDKTHQARVSQHNPDEKGCVHAIDVDVDDGDPTRDLAREILRTCIGHKAVWYVIYNGFIYSRTYNWAARKYTGTDPHKTHVHISIQLTSAAENDETLVLVKTDAPSRWGANYGGAPGTRVIKLWSVGNDVHELQDVLNKWYPKMPALKEDGYYGAKTEERVKYLQKNAKLTVDGIVGAKTWDKLGFEDRIPA